MLQHVGSSNGRQLSVVVAMLWQVLVQLRCSKTRRCVERNLNGMSNTWSSTLRIHTGQPSSRSVAKMYTVHQRTMSRT